MWGDIDEDTDHCARTTKDQLIDRINAMFENLSKESVTSDCNRFRDRIEAVIVINGGYFV